MKELFSRLVSFDLKGLFLTPCDNLFIQMFRYVFVGGVAFVADAGTLWAIAALIPGDEFWQVALATAIAFAVGLIVNYILSKWLVFTKEKAKTGRVAEFVSYGVIGVIGLGITEALMYIGLEWLFIPHELIVKVIAAAIVLVWNFAARKIFLYR